MKPIVLYEEKIKEGLAPFTRMRSVLDIRIGILTLREKWELLSGEAVDIDEQPAGLPANILPSVAVLDAYRNNQLSSILSSAPKIDHPWDICRYNDDMIRQDYLLLTSGRVSCPIPSSNQVISPEAVFIEEGARMAHCSLNASTGPIYIGKNAEIMEGALIRGPFAICQDSVVKMGARIYGASTIGKHCMAGGEIKNSILSDFSNKSHDGYLGDAVIGEWCNIGAGSSNSNIKNTAKDIMIREESTGTLINAGQKCGLMMGDYSRCAINTSFNTGTITGICCNIFGSGLTPTYIRNFSWGFGESVYQWEKAIADIANWKKLKNQSLTSSEIQKLKIIFEQSKPTNT
jgi:UDP-N-acetylglucosamine diphosphorylase/glucosamine-1-phosphate N-acetyltransferase